MTLTTPCPEAQTLHDFLLGLLPPAEAEAAEQHLLTCSVCTTTARSIQAEDCLVASLRCQAALAAPSNEENATAAALIQKLRRHLESEPARPEPTVNPLLTAPETTSGGAEAPTINPDEATQALNFDFLSPAQTQSELGWLGGYRLLAVLGKGGMGVVFHAEDTHLRRNVALKVMKPELAASSSARQRFLREASSAAAVKHDHVVSIYQVGEERNVPFLAMEFLEGESLETRLERERRLPLPEVLRVGREIALGLAAAHARGLIHRDIKPANIWLESSPLAPSGRGPGRDGERVKVLDFGLAREASQGAQLTNPGAILGTPAYMSPEQAHAEPVDARSDLFSLGCVLYRMLAGQRPFQGKDNVSTLLAVTSHQPLAPVRLHPETPQALSDLVMKLLEKNADRRPASATEVAKGLQALEEKLAQHKEIQNTTATGADPRRPRLALVFALVLLGGVMGLGAWAVIRIPGEQGEYIIDTDDPDFAFRVNKGAVTLEDRKTSRNYDLKVLRQDRGKGEHDVEVTDSSTGLSFKTKTFTVKRGERVALKAWFERKEEIATKETVDDAWVKRVAAMPADRQVKVVAAKLMELNPDFDGKLTHKVDKDEVTELQFLTDQVTDISPVRVFLGLRVLDCSGTRSSDNQAKGQLADLTPLGKMNLANLQHLNLGWTKVNDAGLVHFRDCKDLKELYLWGTRVSDGGLVHFKECKALTKLSLGFTHVSDDGLVHFKDCKDLTELDLRALRGVSNVGLAHFKDCKALTKLNLNFTPTADAGLAHFKDCKDLTELHLGGTGVSNAGLACFKECKALTKLSLGYTHVSDDGLAHFKDCKGLTDLDLTTTKVSDAGLAHFKGCKSLTIVWLNDTQLSDLSPLAGMPLTLLHCQNTKMTDLSPLRGMPLKELQFDFKPGSDLAVLRALETLETINGKPAREFWKEVDGKKP